MALNMLDPYIRAERTPPTVTALGVRLCSAYGVGPEAFGCKGNEYHKSGFHRSRAYILNSSQSPYGANDYSVRGARNLGGRADNCSAFDFTPADWGSEANRRAMMEITKNLHDAAVRRDPRVTRDWFEFAGTLDGKTVVTFYADGGEFKQPFDISHLDHVHGSGYRDAVDNDHTGLGDVILGVSGGEGDEDMSFEPMPLNPDRTVHNIPPADAGLADPRSTWLNVTAELFASDPRAALRVWIGDGGGAMAALPGYPDGLLKLESCKTISVRLPKGTRVLSFIRMAVDAQGHIVSADKGTPFLGPISVAYERGPRGQVL